MNKMKFQIKGTHCNSCKMLITDVIEDMGAKIISFDLDSENNQSKVVIETDKTYDELKLEIENEGDYEVSQ